MPKLYQEGLRPRCEDPRRTRLYREGSHPCRHVPADHACGDGGSFSSKKMMTHIGIDADVDEI